MRSHIPAWIIKFPRDVALGEVAEIIQETSPWTKYVPNGREQTMQELTSIAVTGTMDIPVGRVRDLAMGKQYITAFTVGDQLLWRAAEPLRRMLRIVLGEL